MLFRHPKRNGGLVEDAEAEAEVPSDGQASVVEAERGLPLPKHLRAGGR